MEVVENIALEGVVTVHEHAVERALSSTSEIGLQSTSSSVLGGNSVGIISPSVLEGILELSEILELDLLSNDAKDQKLLHQHMLSENRLSNVGAIKIIDTVRANGSLLNAKSSTRAEVRTFSVVGSIGDEPAHHVHRRLDLLQKTIDVGKVGTRALLVEIEGIVLNARQVGALDDSFILSGQLELRTLEIDERSTDIGGLISIDAEEFGKMSLKGSIGVLVGLDGNDGGILESDELSPEDGNRATKLDKGMRLFTVGEDDNLLGLDKVSDGARLIDSTNDITATSSTNVTTGDQGELDESAANSKMRHLDEAHHQRQDELGIRLGRRCIRSSRIQQRRLQVTIPPKAIIHSRIHRILHSLQVPRAATLVSIRDVHIVGEVQGQRQDRLEQRQVLLIILALSERQRLRCAILSSEGVEFDRTNLPNFTPIQQTYLLSALNYDEIATS